MANDSNTIRKRITEFNPTSQPLAGDVKGPIRKHSDPSSTLAQAVNSKPEDGNLRSEIRLVCSDDVPAMPSGDVSKPQI